MTKSILCDYSETRLICKRTISITGAGADAPARQTDHRNKKVMFKNDAPFTTCLSEINNTHSVKGIDIVIPVHSLMKYNDDFWKAFGNLWQCYRDETSYNITDPESFKVEAKITRIAPAAGDAKDFKIIVPWKYLISSWRTLKVTTISCKLSFIVTCLVNSALKFCKILVLL